MVGKIGAKKTTLRQNDLGQRIRFGGGLSTRASPDEVNERDATLGENFDLDYRNSEFRKRKQFDLAGTAPNGEEIRGFAQLITRAGVRTLLVQAGATVYKTDFTTWTSVGTVDEAARLRGPRSHIFELDDVVIITDLSGIEPVYTWNGTVFSEMAHNLTGDFKARYCIVDDERAFFANVESNSVDTEHLIVGSERSDYANLSVSDRPSSSLGDADPFFLLSPDTKQINGFVEAFGLIAFSTQGGQMWKLTGESAKDYAIDKLFAGSAADGDEAVCYVGNDVHFGRAGRLESLSATQKFGDVESDDLTVGISDDVTDLAGWTIVYNARLQKVYYHADGDEGLYVFHKALAGSELSPWSRWTTRHAMAFNPDSMMSLIDPEDGLEYVFCGDDQGNVYRLDGTGSGGDGGTSSIRAFRRSALFSSPGFSETYDMEGMLKYRAGLAATVTVRILWQGQRVFNTVLDLSIPAVSDYEFYGGDTYYGDGSVYGSATDGKIIHERFAVPGQSADYQVEVEIDGTSDFAITELALAFSVAGG